MGDLEGRTPCAFVQRHDSRVSGIFVMYRICLSRVSTITDQRKGNRGYERGDQS